MTKSLDAAVATSASRVAQSMRAALHLVSIVASRSHLRRAARPVHFLHGWVGTNTGRRRLKRRYNRVRGVAVATPAPNANG